MEVCSSTEMGAPGASHLGTGDHGPKTDRSRPRSVPVNAHLVSGLFPDEMSTWTKPPGGCVQSACRNSSLRVYRLLSSIVPPLVGSPKVCTPRMFWSSPLRPPALQRWNRWRVGVQRNQKHVRPQNPGKPSMLAKSSCDTAITLTEE